MRRCVLLLVVIVGALHGGWLSDVVSVIAPFFYMGLMDAGVWLVVAAVAVAGG